MMRWWLVATHPDAGGRWVNHTTFMVSAQNAADAAHFVYQDSEFIDWWDGQGRVGTLYVTPMHHPDTPDVERLDPGRKYRSQAFMGLWDYTLTEQVVVD